MTNEINQIISALTQAFNVTKEEIYPVLLKESIAHEICHSIDIFIFIFITVLLLGILACIGIGCEYSGFDKRLRKILALLILGVVILSLLALCCNIADNIFAPNINLFYKITGG